MNKNTQNMINWSKKHWPEILGALLVATGMILVVSAFKVILDLLIMIGGFVLIYLGLHMLKATAITKHIDFYLHKLINFRSKRR